MVPTTQCGRLLSYSPSMGRGCVLWADIDPHTLIHKPDCSPVVVNASPVDTVTRFLMESGRRATPWGKHSHIMGLGINRVDGNNIF